MKDRWSLLALAAVVAGLALVAYALMTPATMGGEHMGGGRTGYDLLNLVLAILGTAMATGGAVLLLLRGLPEVRPLPPAPAPAAPAPGPEGEADDSRLILRLLSGDEREVFRSLVDAGGEQLQRDIVAVTKLSDAKVSRVLDRLEEKGLVARERRGMGNLVRIAVDRSS